VADEAQQAGEDDLRRRLEDELRRLSVSDLLVQTLYTVSSLGFHRLAPEGRDLEQARLAIEALGALAPVLDGVVPQGTLRDFNQVRANMQLAYAEAAAEAKPEEQAADNG
jgi:hypothetical protein